MGRDETWGDGTRRMGAFALHAVAVGSGLNDASPQLLSDVALTWETRLN